MLAPPGPAFRKKRSTTDTDTSNENENKSQFGVPLHNPDSDNEIQRCVDKSRSKIKFI